MAKEMDNSSDIDVGLSNTFGQIYRYILQGVEYSDNISVKLKLNQVFYSDPLEEK